MPGLMVPFLRGFSGSSTTGTHSSEEINFQGVKTGAISDEEKVIGEEEDRDSDVFQDRQDSN